MFAPLPPFPFECNLKTLERMRGVTPEDNSFIAKHTSFLMEIFKFMPKATAYKYNAGISYPFGNLRVTDLQEITIEENGIKRPLTIDECGSYFSALNGIVGVINDKNLILSKNALDKLEEKENCFPMIFEQLYRLVKTKYYEGIRNYKKYEYYDRQYANQVPPGTTLPDSIKKVAKEEFGYPNGLVTYSNGQLENSSQPNDFSWGLTHAQETKTGKGKALMLDKEYNWYLGISNFAWDKNFIDCNNPVGMNEYHNDFILQNVRNSQFTDVYNYDQIVSYYSASVLQNHINALSFLSNDNYYDIAKKCSYVNFSDSQVFSLLILMLESKRRFLYGMTKIFGPHTQGVITKECNGSTINPDNNEENCKISNVDDYMIGKFDNVMTEFTNRRISGLKISFLGTFYESSHEFINFLNLMTTNKTVHNQSIDGTQWVGDKDRESLQNFRSFFINKKNNIVSYFQTIYPIISKNSVKSYIDGGDFSGAINLINNNVLNNYYTFEIFYKFRSIRDCLENYRREYQNAENDDQKRETINRAKAYIDDENVWPNSIFDNFHENYIKYLYGELFNEGCDTFSFLPNGFVLLNGSNVSWDRTQGNCVSNAQQTGSGWVQITGQHHYYSPAQAIANAGTVYPSRNWTYSLNYIYDKDGKDIFPLLEIENAKPYDKVWGSHVTIYLLNVANWDLLVKLSSEWLVNSYQKRAYQQKLEQWKENVEEENKNEAKFFARYEAKKKKNKKQLEKRLEEIKKVKKLELKKILENRYFKKLKESNQQRTNPNN